MNGIAQLAKCFSSFSASELGTLSMEFHDFRALPLDQLPTFDAKEAGRIDHFWYDVASVPSVMDLEVFHFEVLSSSASVVQVLLQCACLFSMVRMIVTEEGWQLDPSTVCDLLSEKLNNEKPCSSKTDLIGGASYQELNHQLCEEKTSPDTL